MKFVSFLAQFPPPLHGLSKAVETLYNSNLNKEYCFSCIDIKENKKICRSIYKLITTKSDLIYFTISQSVGGNLRDLLFLALIQLRHRRCLVHLHGGYFRKLIDKDCHAFQRRVNCYFLRRLAGGIVLGDSFRKIFEGIIPDNRIFVVPNCVDSEYLLEKDSEKMKIQDTLSKKQLDILYLSNFIDEKGYKEVLDLARYVKQKGDNRFRFHFAGKFFNDNEESFFHRYISENGLSDRVSYYGVVTHGEKNGLLKQCDVFTLLTHYPKEGQPIAILEAMGNAAYILSTRHAGIPDVVKDGINGMLLDVDNINIETMYQEICRLYDNREELASVQRRNYCDVLEKYREDTYVGNMKKVFEKVLVD